jgi:hypothetical protein
MAKEKVKHQSGVFASVFAHAEHIWKEKAKEISGLADHEFEKAQTDITALLTRSFSLSLTVDLQKTAFKSRNYLKLYKPGFSEQKKR